MSQRGRTNSDVCVQEELEPIAPSEDRPNVPTTNTMATLVQAARDLDKNWRMFAGPPRSGPRCPGIRALDDKPNMEINAFQGKPKKRGKLTPEERKYRMDNNLCLYCGKPGHKA